MPFVMSAFDTFICSLRLVVSKFDVSTIYYAAEEVK